MIYGQTFQGSGIGNQLHRYVATRITAKRLGVDYRMVYVPDGSGKQEGFKADFLPFDQSKLVTDVLGDIVPLLTQYREREIRENGTDVRSYDPEFNFIQDNTLIDGEFQDERYWENENIDEWLKVDKIDTGNCCVIGFRGGEFSVFPDLFLPKSYWDEAISKIREMEPTVDFVVHTDDKSLAKDFFPDFPVIHDPKTNWTWMRNAKYAIIANSSFFIFPRWLRQKDGGAFTVAPRFWARRNTRTWALPANFYKDFIYI